MMTQPLPIRQERGMTMLGMLMLLVIAGFMALVAMKVVPMYIQLYTIKSTIESVRNEPQLAQMTVAEIQSALQKRFDIGYVDKLQARNLKFTNEPEGRMLHLVYADERPLFYGLHALLKVEEIIPMTPKK